MHPLPHVTIIILNWNGRSYLDSCLNAIAQLDYPTYDIILADNNSSDDSIPFITANFPWVNILQNHQNLGYAAGNNRALRQLTADFAVLVNPDIIVSRSWLRELIKPMLADPAIAVAGCKLYFPEGHLLQHAGGTIQGPRSMPNHFGVGQDDQGHFDQLKDVDYVTGAAMALRRTALESIGYFDEGFFMYFEEADLCARARTAGYRVVYVPQAAAIHDESAFAVRGSPAYLQRFHYGRWRYLLKHFHPQTIIKETFAAEEAWLADVPWEERRAVNKAYRAVFAGQTEIFAARKAAAEREFSKEQQQIIHTKLNELRQKAAKNEAYQMALAQLDRAANLEVQPFTSDVPLFGSLIARLRQLWAAVASTENAHSYTSQQNEFNDQLLQKLEELAKRLPDTPDRWLEQDNNLGQVQQQHKDAAAELKGLIQQLNTIEQRLKRLENKSASIQNDS